MTGRANRGRFGRRPGVLVFALLPLWAAAQTEQNPATQSVVDPTLGEMIEVVVGGYNGMDAVLARQQNRPPQPLAEDDLDRFVDIADQSTQTFTHIAEQLQAGETVAAAKALNDWQRQFSGENHQELLPWAQVMENSVSQWQANYPNHSLEEPDLAEIQGFLQIFSRQLRESDVNGQALADGADFLADLSGLVLDLPAQKEQFLQEGDGLSREIRQLQTLAAVQGMDTGDGIAVEQLLATAKQRYAEHQLGTPNPRADRRLQAQLEFELLQAKTPLTPAQQEQLSRLLQGLGGDFADIHRRWQGVR